MRLLSTLLLAVGLLGLLGSVLFGGGFYGSLFVILVGVVLRMLVNQQRPVSASGEAESPSTHVRCPDCRELVRWDASKCKHCGSALKPWAAPPDQPQPLPAAPPRTEEWRG